MKNQMILKDNNVYDGFEIKDIKEFKQIKDDDTKIWKQKYSEVLLWNRFAKQMQITNPEITTIWSYIKSHYNSQNHIESFINKIFTKIKEKELEVSQIGKINAKQNSTRGLASTMDMHLMDINNTTLLKSEEHIDKYYNM